MTLPQRDSSYRTLLKLLPKLPVVSEHIRYSFNTCSEARNRMSKWLKWAAENLSPATMVRDSEFGGDYVVYLEGGFRPCAQVRVLSEDKYEFCHYDSLSKTGWRIQVANGSFEEVVAALLVELNEMASLR